MQEERDGQCYEGKATLVMGGRAHWASRRLHGIGRLCQLRLVQVDLRNAGVPRPGINP